MPHGGILDEAQRFPEILSYLQEEVDRDDRPGRFIVTGSHQLRLHEAITQSLAGRTAMLSLWPLSVRELRRHGIDCDPFHLIASGFYPRLHPNGWIRAGSSTAICKPMSSGMSGP